MRLIVAWVLNAIAILLVAYLVPGIHVDSFWAALVVALVLGFLNAILRPLLIILTLPINIITLGLFTLVINALILLLVSAIVSGFSISGFWTAVLGGVVLAILRGLVGAVMGSPKNRPLQSMTGN